MKIIALLFVLVYVVEDISCNNILTKFHQHGFKLKDVRIKLTSFDKNYYNIFQIKVFKYNRTTAAHNITFNHKVDLKDQQVILVQAYKFLSNEYREVALRFQINFRKSCEANVIGIGALPTCGNLTSCYFYKHTTYHICNFVVDETRFPPFIPSGKYRIEVKCLYLNQDFSWVDIFGEVYTPIEYPKK